jgi:predicted transcriptional regulator
MIRTQIQLTKEQVDRLKKLAAEKHLSVAKLIRQAVDALIKSRAAVEDEERRRRAIAAAGRFHSGVSDLSTAHDKYLGKAYK